MLTGVQKGIQKMQSAGDTLDYDLTKILTAIVSQCDQLESMTVPDTEIAKKVAVIRRMVEFAMNEVRDHQRKADAAARLAG